MSELRLNIGRNGEKKQAREIEYLFAETQWIFWWLILASGISHRVLNPYPVLQKSALDWKRLASLRLLTHDFFQGSYSLFRVRSHSVVSVDFRVSDDAISIDDQSCGKG